MFKIGIFGGSFNPPHNGHVNIAINTKNELMLNKMIIMPTGTSPHKDKAKVSFEDRYEMCRLAFSGYPDFEVSDMEGRTRGRNYTIDTLRILKKQYPSNSQFHLLIGADMLFYFEQWYKYESILKECTVVAVARENGQYVDMLEYATELGRVKVLNLPVRVVSSSQIRDNVENNIPIDSLVPEKVGQYIKEKNLYI